MKALAVIWSSLEFKRWTHSWNGRKDCWTRRWFVLCIFLLCCVCV